MNNPTPLVPQGTIDPKNKSRARVKIGVFFVLAVHGAGLLALLLQGCHREDGTAQANQTTNSAPAFEATNLPMVSDPSVPQATNQAPVVQETTPPAPAPASEYTVASGDKLSTIAKKFNVTVAALKDANPGVEPTKLQIGKTLHIPAATPKAPVASGTSAAVAAPADSAGGAQMHTVKSGDTLIKIAMAKHTTVKAIRAANNLKSDRITVGQKLKIPAKSLPVASTETASTTPAVPTGAAASH